MTAADDGAEIVEDTASGAGHVDATPTPDGRGCTLQRAEPGRWRLSDGSGAVLEADAAAFVEVTR